MYHGTDPKLERQHVQCENCGQTMILLPIQSVEWSLFKVVCEICSIYMLLSKFFIKDGTECPQCKLKKIRVLERWAGTQQMIQVFRDQGFEIWQYTHGGAVKV